MNTSTERIVKSTQEQAIAAWVDQLNTIRLNNLIAALKQQDMNLEEALSELAELKKFCGDPSHILGNDLTKHGEIAEHMQVNFSNARNLVDGLKKEYTFNGVGRTAPEDYLFNGEPVQSKFYNGTKNTLLAIQRHLEKYPDFVKSGGSYDIPKDQYEEIQKILNLRKTNPSALSKEEYRIWNSLKEFQENTDLLFGEDIHSGVVDYNEVQTGVAEKTISNEEKYIRARDKENRDIAKAKAEPSFEEGTKVAIVSGAVEGGLTFGIEIYKKRKEGKHFSDFTAEDWKDIGTATGKRGFKGTVRGGAIYALTNYTKTPSNVASAYVTAAFGVGAQLYAYGNNKITTEELLLNCEVVCMDAAVSAVSSLLGQTLIPVPILGSVIGNVVGQFVYEIGKELATDEQKKVFENYKTEVNQLEKKLDKEHLAFVNKTRDLLKRFENLEQLAFDPQINISFNGSIEYALALGVEKQKILTTKEEIFDYFMN